MCLTKRGENALDVSYFHVIVPQISNIHNFSTIFFKLYWVEA